jgi:hypothetical protein
MNREELNWVLQTIRDAANAERFVLAQYQRGRISFQLMVDIVRERGWINCTANPFAITTGDLTEDAATGFPMAIA